MTLFQIMARSYGMGGSDKEGLRKEIDAIAKLDSVRGHVARGMFYQLVEDSIGPAGRQFELAFGLAPDSRAAAISYTDYLWETGRKDAAIQVLTAFLDSIPDDRTVCFNLGIKTLLTGTGYAAAESLFTDCLTFKSETGLPSEPMVRWCLALAYHLDGKHEMADTEWQRVYETDPDFDDVLRGSPDLAELNSILESEP